VAKLTYRQRKRLRSTSFALPEERRYPIDTLARGRNALARVSAFGTESEKRKVRRAVRKRYPSLR
jgi:hypothetical protein